MCITEQLPSSNAASTPASATNHHFAESRFIMFHFVFEEYSSAAAVAIPIPLLVLDGSEPALSILSMSHKNLTITFRVRFADLLRELSRALRKSPGTHARNEPSCTCVNIVFFLLLRIHVVSNQISFRHLVPKERTLC